MTIQPQRAGACFFAIVVSAVLLQAACRDTGGNENAPPIIADERVHMISWSGSDARQFSAGRVITGGSGNAVAPVLSSDTTTFWAYTYRETTSQISVMGADGWEPFVTFQVPQGSLLRRPNGSPFSSVDSIEITVTVDPQDLQVTFEPSGLTFKPLKPAHLTMSYASADPDYDGDGILGEADDYIAQVLLGIRERQHPGAPWMVLPSLNDVLSRSLSADVSHFTGYAVSW